MNFVIKAVIVATWVLIAVSFFGVIPPPWALALQGLGAVLLVAHAAELVVFNKIISARAESRPAQIVMTMIFGFFYWKF